MMGRPTKLDQDVIDIVCKAMEIGATRRIAAQAAGVHIATLFAWLAKGKEQETGIYRDFYDKVKKAEGMCCLRDLSIITKASIEDWRASAWRLERRYGYTVHQQPQIEVHIDADNISVTQLLGELAATEAKISQLTGPIIDLDEE